jgi:4-hydroxybenzoate polyprenyltransferase
MVSNRTATTKLRGVIRLTRWKEYVPFVVPVTAFGSILAVQAQPNAALNWRLVTVILANILVVAYAFMINDIEDAPDDAREAARAARNPVACGELTIREGWIASGIVAVLTMLLYAVSGPTVFWIGLLTLVISHLYSWKPVRLKAWPITDFVSHSLMLSGLLFLSGYFAYDNSPGGAWLVALAVTLVSCYGQIYNQLRDYDMDKAAGLHNTAILLGKKNAQRLMYVFIGGALVCLGLSLVMRIIPLWVAFIPILVALVFFFKRGSGKDMRGGEAVDLTGSMQMQFVAIANATIGVWLVATVIGIH